MGAILNDLWFCIIIGVGFCLALVFVACLAGITGNIWKAKRWGQERQDDARVVIDVFRNDDDIAIHMVGALEDAIGGVWHAEIVHPHPNDGVDVHDHTVQNSLTSSFNALKTWYDKETRPRYSMSAIKSAIFSSGSPVDTVEKAYSTVRSIEKINSKISSIDTDEVTVLQMVWARINDSVNNKVRADLVDSLIRQLADAAVNLDMSRCASGRVTRLIHALEAIDTENIISITSTENIRRELGDKVPLLIAKYEGNTNIVDLIDKELRADYVESKLLTPTVYESLVKDYLDAAEDYRTSESQTGHLVENVDNQSVIQSR